MRRRVRKFQGGGMDASKSDFKTPGSGSYSRSYNPGAGGVVQHGGGGAKSNNTGGGNNKTVTKPKKKVSPFSTTNEPTDTPYKSNMLLNLAAGLVFPGGGVLMEGAQRRNYKKKQEFARDQGLYRDFYRTEGKTFQPNNPKNRQYMKDAGYGRSTTTTQQKDDRAPTLCPDGTPPPCDTMMAAKPAKPVKPGGRNRVEPMDLGFKFKRGGLSGGKRFGPPPKKGPDPHGKCPFRPDGIRGVGAVEPGRGVKFVGVK
jgi:hypothetical protein